MERHYISLHLLFTVLYGFEAPCVLVSVVVRHHHFFLSCYPCLVSRPLSVCISPSPRFPHRSIVTLVERPFRIPIPDWAAVLLVLPPTLGIFVIFAISNWYVFAFSFGSIVVGYLLFQFGRVVKRKKWFAFNERNPVLRYSEYAVAPAATADDTTDPSSTEESYSSSPDIGVGNAEGCYHGSDPPWEYPKEGDVEFQVIDTAAEERDIL